MAIHVIKKPKNISFEKVGIKGWKFDTKNITNKSGFIYVETEKGHETIIINHECDCYYYILDGNGYFEIDEIKENFEKDDLVVIPAKSKFTYKGKCKLLRITTPAFYPEQEETV